MNPSAVSDGCVTHRGTICVHLLGPAPVFLASGPIFCAVHKKKIKKRFEIRAYVSREMYALIFKK
jgi:hypothetical protein